MSFDRSSSPAAAGAGVVDAGAGANMPATLACDAAPPASGSKVRGGCGARKLGDQEDHFEGLKASGYEAIGRAQGYSKCKPSTSLTLKLTGGRLLHGGR